MNLKKKVYICILLVFVSLIFTSCKKNEKIISQDGYNFELIKHENVSEGQKHVWRVTTDGGNSVYEGNTITAVGGDKIIYRERTYTYIFEDTNVDNYKITVTYPSGKKVAVINNGGVITRNWENGVDDTDEELKADLLTALILVNAESSTTYRPQIAFFVFIIAVGFLIMGLFELVTSLFKWNLDFDRKAISGTKSLTDSKKRKIKAIVECIAGVILYIISNLI